MSIHLAIPDLPRLWASRPVTCVRTSRWVRRGDERGATTLEMVLLMTALFALMFLGLQASLYYHARSVAIAAAQEGAREAGSQTGTQASGVSAAQRFITQAGGRSVIGNSQITGSRTPTYATVTVTGDSMSVISGFHLRIHQSATVPLERLTSDAAGPGGR